MIETSSLKPQASCAQASNLTRSKLKVAVVVPVYNIEGYLGECLESVLAQTHRELEVVVVDDGSTDKSGEISDDFARRDPRVRVIHKANGGLSDARNAALDVVTAPFVTFVDGDDVLHPQFVERLLAITQSSQLSAQTSSAHPSSAQALTTHASMPIAVARWKKFTREEEINEERGAISADTVAAHSTPPSLKPQTSRAHCSLLTAHCSPLTAHALTAHCSSLTAHALDAQSALLSIFYQEKITNSACARLFDTRLFDGLRFPVGRLYEDIAIVYDLVMRAGAVAYLDEPLYYYRQEREGSITNRYTPARYDIVEILDDLETRISAENPTILPALHSRQASAAFNLLQLMPATEKDRIDHCWGLITARRAACLRDGRVRLKNKAALVLSFLGKRLTTSLLRKL